MATKTAPKLRRLRLVVNVPVKGEFLGDCGFHDLGYRIDLSELADSIDGDRDAQLRVSQAINTLQSYRLIDDLGVMRRRTR